MPDFDKETLEYFKGNLEREVRDNVEGRLFKTWLALTAAFMAGVGLVGAPWLLSYLDDKISKAVQTHVNEKIAEPTAKAKRLAEEAETTAQAAKDKIAAALTDIDLRRKFVDDTLVELRTKSNVATDQVATLRASLDTRKHEIDEALKAARERVSEIDDRATQLSDRLRNAVPDAGVLTSLTVDVKAVIGEVSRLNSELQRIAAKVGVAPAPEATRAQQEQIAKLEETASQRTQTAEKSAGLTVYVQFAGLNRDYVKALSAQIARAGFNVPGEERLAAAANLREIRCFYDSDCHQAEKLKPLIESYLSDLYKDNRDSTRSITVKPLYNFTPKPRQGIIEVWLGLANPA